MAENEGGMRIPFETKVKENFSTEWGKADTPDKKKSLIQRILKIIKDMMANADTAVNEAEKAKSGVIPRNAKEAKEAAAQPVIEFLQFLTGNNGQPLDIEALQSLGLNDTQQTFIQTLASKTQSADSATFLANIINKATDKDNPQYLTLSKPGEPKTQLERDFEMIRLNPVAAMSLKESMQKLAEKGSLKDTQGNVLTVEDVKNRFSSESQNEQQQPHEQQKQSQKRADEEDQETRNPNERPNMRARRRRKQENLQLIQEYSMYMDRFKKTNSPELQEIEDKLQANRHKLKGLADNVALTAESRREQARPLEEEQEELDSRRSAFNAEESAALDYLVSDVLSPPFLSTTETEEDKGDAIRKVRTYLKNRFGVTTDEEFRRIQDVFKEGTGLLDGSYEGYQDLAQVFNSEFTAELMGQKIIKNGLLDLSAVQELQAKIEDEIGVLFETLYNSPKGNFNDAFSSYSEGQMLRKIVQHLRVEFNAILETIPDSGRKNKMKEVLNDIIISPIQRRPSLEQIVHQYQQVGATIDLEKLKDILKTYNITTLQEFYNDDLTKIISDLLPTFIQKKFVQNNNNMINDLFQLVQVENKLNDEVVYTTGENKNSKRFVVQYREECINYMHEVINAMYKSQGRPEVSKDRINARFSRAYLDNFLLSLRGIKVMSKANPMHHTFGDLPFANLITGVFNPLQGWGKFGLRGRGHQESGDAETSEYSGMNNFAYNEIAAKEYIEKYGDVFDNFHPAQMKKEGDKRILYEVFPGNDELMSDLRTGKWDAYYSMLEVYRGMVFGNVIDQSGWVFEGFNKNTIKKLSELYMKDEKGNPIPFDSLTRKQKMELKYKTSGVVTAFWDTGGYASEDTMNQFVKFLFDKELDFKGAIERKTQLTGRALTEEEIKAVKAEEVKRVKETKMNSMDWLKTTGEYTKGGKRFDKIFDVTHGEKKKQMAFREYRMYRETALLGEVFHQLLLKDPNAWLGEMVQTYPALREGHVEYTDNKGNKKTVLASQFYFNLSTMPDSSLSKDDKVKRDRFRFEILPKFRGKEEDDYLTNVKHLQKIMDFYAKLFETVENKVDKQSAEYINASQEEKLAMIRKGADTDKAINTLDIQLSIAHQLAVSKHESKIDKKDINDDNIRNLMYAEDGLVTHFDNMVHERPNYFGDGETDLGEENSFYQRWAYSREQSGTKPLPEGDTNMKYLFEDIRNTQALDRRLGTDMAFAKAQEVLGKVPGVLKKAADADNFSGWFGAVEELHKEMSIIADEDQKEEQKYQQLLYQTICNWFSLDSDTEKFLFGPLMQMKLGTDGAMATLKSNNMSKFVLDQDSRRQYLVMLLDKAYLKGNYDAIGGWGFDTAEMIAGVGLGEIVRKQVMYAITSAIVVTIATAIKEGYDEEVEED